MEGLGRWKLHATHRAHAAGRAIEETTARRVALCVRSYELALIAIRHPLDSDCPHPVPANAVIQDDAREAMVASGPVSSSLHWTASDQTSIKRIFEKQACRRYHTTHAGPIQLLRSFLELNSRGGIQAGVPGQLRWHYRARRR